MTVRIAVLEDDDALAEQLAAALSNAGHRCRVFSSGEALLTALPRETFDLLLIDWNLPGISGMEVLGWVRHRSTAREMPVIFVTARSDGADAVNALNAGADDYVVKPVRADELLARLGALLRRSFPGQVMEQLAFGRFLFNVPHERLTSDGEELALTSKEFQLALLLLSNANRALSRDYLMATIWNSKPELQTRTLDAHISKVRAKLGLRPERGYRLVPIYSFGYRLEILGSYQGE